MLEGRVHVCALHLGIEVPEDRAPERLDQHALLLHDLLKPHGDFATLVGVGDRHGGCQLFVELGIREGRFVPCFAGAIGKGKDLHAQGTHVPFGAREGILGPVVPEGGAGNDGALDLEARLAALLGQHVRRQLALLAGEHQRGDAADEPEGDDGGDDDGAAEAAEFEHENREDAEGGDEQDFPHAAEAFLLVFDFAGERPADAGGPVEFGDFLADGGRDLADVVANAGRETVLPGAAILKKRPRGIE